MKLFIDFVALFSLLTSAYALTDPSVYLWTVDTGVAKQESNQVTSVSAELASAVIARRRGHAKTFKASSLDASDLSDVERLGGYQFGATPEASAQAEPVKVFISITGFQGAVSSFNSLPDLWIEKPGTKLPTLLEVSDKDDTLCEHDISPKTKPGVRVVYQYRSNDGSCLKAGDLAMVPSLMVIASAVPGPDTVGGTGITTFLRSLRHLAAVDRVESTLLVFPPIKSAKTAGAKSELERYNLKAPIVELQIRASWRQNLTSL